MMRRVGRHRGYLAVFHSNKPRTPKPVTPALPKATKAERVERWAQLVWKRHGCMFGDWAVAAMTEEQRNRYIGGGDKALDRQARESMDDGLCDAMIQMGVPLDIVDDVRRSVKRMADL